MDVRGEKVVVVGMGRTALALVRLLLREGARPIVSEREDSDRLRPLVEELEGLGVDYECGGHTKRAFAGASLVIPSPGAPPSIEPIRQAEEDGASVFGEMEFAYGHCRSRILAVTGTNGKTTTTALLHRIIATCGHSVALAGNNDSPFSEAVMADPPPEFVVLEVSSYQLERVRRFRPWIGAVLNVSPDHLARHRTMEEYALVKQRIFANQEEGDIAVLNHDDFIAASMVVPEGAERWYFSLEERVPRGLWMAGDAICDGDNAVAGRTDTVLPGRHNLENVLAALTMARAGDFSWPEVLKGLHAFEGVEHRIEHVATCGGVAFYNDSKSTNVESLRVALESFDGPVVLLAGGRGKGADYRVLRDLVQRRVRRLVVMGEDAPALEAAFGDLVPATRAVDMADAVRLGSAEARPGDVVLLSPACASFDMYENFEQRGHAFKDSVIEYAKGLRECSGRAC